jgi:L-threonylcarbamoyladenylate synthase
MRIVDVGDRPTSRDAEIVGAADALRRGEIVAYVTETVYGMACDARDRDACARLCDLKGRGVGHTLPVQVFEAAAPYWPWPLPSEAKALFAAFSPGPITVVVPGGEGLAPQAVGEGGTAAIRVPAHPVARALLAAFAGPVACPSANRTGEPPALDAETVDRNFPSGVAVILRGEREPSGAVSTIVDVASAAVRVLRKGAIPEEEIRRCLEGR